ncbi:hypothetical protein [Treponema bryantii]|uniref:hypothetical protein n=1 Tax=Treponema bryantii TaxID=163 RepID=UPI0003B387C3|nr:hypothetical protein [Treponema bryantii]
MINPENLPEIIENMKWQDVQRSFVYPPERPPVRLLKAETGLPVNIINITYGVSFELGLTEWIKVQTNTNDQIDDKNYEIFWFTENAETILEQTEMPDNLLEIVQEYIKKSYADEKSLLYTTMQKRKEEWESDVKKMKEERKAK